MQLGRVIHNYNPSTQESEVGESLVEVQPGLQQQGTEGRGKYVVVIFPTSARTLTIFKRLNKFEKIRALKPRIFEK